MLRERLETSWSSNTCSKSLFRGISCLEVFTLCAGEILENFGLQNEHDHGAKVNSFKPRADAINCLYFTFLPLYMLFKSVSIVWCSSASRSCEDHFTGKTASHLVVRSAHRDELMAQLHQLRGSFRGRE